MIHSSKYVFVTIFANSVQVKALKNSIIAFDMCAS